MSRIKEILNLRLLSLAFAITLVFTLYAQEPADAIESEVVIHQVDTVSVYSTKMDKDIKNVVIVPAQYFDEDEKEVPYSVVYLLHGYSGKYSDWIKHKPELEDLASQYDMIFVCPDGQDSWYFDSPIDPKMQFETYITQELIPFIDENYRTRGDGANRGIAGLSMGGHGALWLAFRHPDLFSACGSMSGGVDITSFPDKWKIKDRLGEYASNKGVWDSHSVLGLVPTYANKGQHIIFDCGSSDFMFDINNKLHDALLKKGVAHDYIVRPGTHNWEYWTNSLDYQLLFFSKVFDSLQGGAE